MGAFEDTAAPNPGPTARPRSTRQICAAAYLCSTCSQLDKLLLLVLLVGLLVPLELIGEDNQSSSPPMSLFDNLRLCLARFSIVISGVASPPRRLSACEPGSLLLTDADGNDCLSSEVHSEI